MTIYKYKKFSKYKLIKHRLENKYSLVYVFSIKFKEFYLDIVLKLKNNI